MIGGRDKMKIETIHDSLMSGQRRQMVKQIDEYGTYDFWSDYKDWLFEAGYCDDVHKGVSDSYEYFTDATISYFRTKGR
jgi:hypothetical protein